MKRPELNRLIVGDALVELRRLPASSVDMVLTSPPYYRLRDYGVTRQLGQEPDVRDWVAALRLVLAEVRRVLVPTGTLWLNLGDSYSLRPEQGATRKSLLLGPEQVALGLVADGWTLRNKIVWQKTNPMPSPVRDRLSCTWEPVFVFSKQPSYFFNLDAIRKPHRSSDRSRSAATAELQPETWRGSNALGRTGLAALKREGRVGHRLGKNPGDVWAIGTSGYRGPHPATFPELLAGRAIAAGCPQLRCSRCHAPWRSVLSHTDGNPADPQPSCTCRASAEPGRVLDPFMGVGTTAIAAEQRARNWLGIELNARYAAEAQARIERRRPPTARVA